MDPFGYKYIWNNANDDGGKKIVLVCVDTALIYNHDLKAHNIVVFLPARPDHQSASIYLISCLVTDKKA